MSDIEPLKKKLKAKFFEEGLFMRVRVKANCDFVFAARGNFSYSYTPLPKVLLGTTKECHCFIESSSLSRFCLYVRIMY